MLLIFGALLLLYYAYEKYCEAKQIESISKIQGLTYQEIKDLINEIKK